MVFLNIFDIDSKNIESGRNKSNKPEKVEKQATIIIDTREKQSLIASNLLERKANIKFETLEIADYIVGDIVIERKTFSDFISSMINKRLFSQLDALKKYPNHFLIIESKKESENKNLEKASKGMILSIITKYKIPIIFTENDKDTAEILIILAKQQSKKETEQSLRYTPTLLTKEEQKQFILEGFPEIGPVTAKKLLEKYKTLKNIFNAPEEELKELLGARYPKFKSLLYE